MTPVKDIMSDQVVVVSPELSLRDLVELLAHGHLGGAPVVAQGRVGRVVGVITLNDVASFLANLAPVPRGDEGPASWDEEPPPGTVAGEDVADGAYYQELWADAGADLVERAQATGSPEWDLLGEHTVEEAMTRRLWEIDPDAPVVQAARLMQEKNVHRLLVMRNGRLVGLITTADITRAVAEGRLE